VKRYLLIALIIFLAGATYLTNFFIKKERSFDEVLRLKQENQNLQAQIQKLEIGNWKLEIPQEKFLAVKVFSTYPFNVKNQITINAGEKQGIKKNMVTVLGQDILVGKVTEVFENYSVIQTIFDPNWQLPVRMGKEEVNGLFEGGNEPKVTMIEKEKEIKMDDVVYSASQEFPYGLKVGEVAKIKETAAGVFKEAVLKMPFNVGELREVNVIK
jgi:rod shape-determining protein MreC